MALTILENVRKREKQLVNYKQIIDRIFLALTSNASAFFT